jgi:hypothetical protein
MLAHAAGDFLKPTGGGVLLDGYLSGRQIRVDRQRLLSAVTVILGKQSLAALLVLDGQDVVDRHRRHQLALGTVHDAEVVVATQGAARAACSRGGC